MKNGRNEIEECNVCTENVCTSFCKLRILSGEKDYKSLGYQLNCLTCKMLKMISNSGIFTKFFRTQKK